MYQNYQNPNPYQQLPQNSNWMNGQNQQGMEEMGGEDNMQYLPGMDNGYGEPGGYGNAQGYAEGGSVASGSFVEHDDDYDDYHQDTDYDDYDDAGHEYPAYYNDLIRAHYARGGTVSNLPAYLRAAAGRAGTAIRPILNKIASGAMFAGNKLAQGARYAGNQAYRAGTAAYNRLPNNPFRRGAPAGRGAAQTAPAAARTWADTFGSAGRTAGTIAGNLGGRMVGTGVGAIAGPAVTQLAARGMFPYVPSIIRDPLASLVGGMAGAPAGSFLGSRIGQRVGESLGERGGRLVGRGVDYLAGNYAPIAARAQNAATNFGSGLSSAASAVSHIARNPGQYTPASLMARRAGEMFSAGLPGVPTAPAREGWGSWLGRHAGNAMSTINSYSPATMAVNAMGSLPQFTGAANIRPGGDSPMHIDTRRRDGSAFGMPGFTDEAAMPLLGSPRGRRDSTDSFMTARSGSPLFDLEPD